MNQGKDFPPTRRIGILVFPDFEPLDVWGFVEAFAIARFVGTGYATSPDYAAVIPEAVSHEPDIVVVSGGRNDLAGGTIADIEPAVVEFYSQLRDALPDARIIVTSPLWDEAPTPPELVELRHIVEREAERVGAEYVDLGDMFEGRADLIAADGLHPNEEGLQLIAERIDDLLADS